MVCTLISNLHSIFELISQRGCVSYIVPEFLLLALSEKTGERQKAVGEGLNPNVEDFIL